MGNAVEDGVVGTDLARVQETLGGPEWLKGIREAARVSFETHEWPTTSEEEWRRTSLRAFEFDSYGAGGSSDGAVPTESGSESVLRFENGALVAATLTQAAIDAGVVAGGLGTIADAAADRVRAIVTKSVDEADNRIVSWHYGLVDDAAVVVIPANVTVEDPITIDVELSGDEEVVSPHLVVLAERGSQATIVRRVSTDEDGEVLILDGADIMVEENARLSLVNCQFANEESIYFANDRCSIARDGFLHRTEAALGSDFVKTRFSCDMAGSGSDAVLNGLYFAADEQHMDIRTVQRHMAPHATSRSFYRGAVRDESHAIYQGLIQVDGEAAGTDAYLTNKNLILGEEARADSIPSLNIKTDDVRCSHGSTTGKLDAAQLFYLQSRGFPLDEARKTLIQGYFEDLAGQVPEDVAEAIRDRIAERVPE